MFRPLKHMNAIAIRPTVMKVMPSPCNGFGRQDLTAAAEYLALALAAGTLTATSRRQVNTCFSELSEERTAGCYVIFLVAVDGDFDVAGRYEVFLSHQQDDDQQENYTKENSYCI